MIYRIYKITDLLKDKSFYNFIKDVDERIFDEDETKKKIEKIIRYNYQQYLNNDKYNKQYISLFKNVNLSYKTFYEVNDIIKNFKKEKYEELMRKYPKERDIIIRRNNNEKIEFLDKNCKEDYSKTKYIVCDKGDICYHYEDSNGNFKLYKIDILDKIVCDNHSEGKKKFNELLKNINDDNIIDSDRKNKINYNRNDKITCHICGGKYILSNKYKHIKTKKHIKFNS
jgi:hypothetical protein